MAQDEEEFEGRDRSYSEVYSELLGMVIAKIVREGDTPQVRRLLSDVENPNHLKAFLTREEQAKLDFNFKF